MSVSGRKIAIQLAKAWEKTSQKVSYKRALARESNEQIIKKAKDKLYDGIILELNERNSDKSQKMQHKILRRIIEKRQAQAVHKIIGHGEDLFASRLSNVYSRRCMRKLYRYQNCLPE